MAKTWETALISGGGSGIGLRLAEEFLGMGARVALIDLAFKDGGEGAPRQGGRRESRRPLLDLRGRRERRPELLANVARAGCRGAGHPRHRHQLAPASRTRSEFEKMSEEQFRRVVEINLFGSRNFAAAALPHLQQGAQLALVASLAGIVSNYGYTAYNASKFGVVGFAGALRLECQPKGIAVTVICPPEVETPMVEAERREAPVVTMKLKEFAGTLELEPAVREILAGLRAREFMVIPGSRARLTRRLAGIFPGLLRNISDGIVRKTLAPGRR